MPGAWCNAVGILSTPVPTDRLVRLRPPGHHFMLNRIDAVTIEVCTKDTDYYRRITVGKLLDLLQIEDLFKRKAALLNESWPFPISSSSAVDFVIILDGENDDASWAYVKDKLEHL